MSDTSTQKSDDYDRTMEAIKDWFEDLNITDFYSIPFIAPKKESENSEQEKTAAAGKSITLETGKYYRNKKTGQVVWVNPYGQPIDQTTLSNVEVDGSAEWEVCADK